ncbi:LppX_LprAFG lipoprotein [Nocardioides sp. SYSU D00038]|uniref:LppX_LprAFG lipoprotein n=1 Tax=Nocardioides sp. SYSU D00038 TaxID=2812554 RepID=UPI0019681B99|nr:LppX_LprAFG lipoprotein [Nocardioides sp. SYSU D00038]
MTRTTLSRTTWRRACAALALPLALTLTACGGDSDEPSDDAGSSASSTPTEDAEPSEEPTEEESDTPGGESVEAGEFAEIMSTAFENATTAAATLKSTGGPTAIDATGDIDFTGKQQAVHIEMNNPAMGGKLTLIMVKGIVYVGLPNLDGKFVQFDLADPNNPMGAGFADNLDPEKAFEQLEQGIESVSLVGEEEVGGETATHYAALIDATKIDAAAGAGQGEMTFDVWIDGEGRIVKNLVELGSTGSVETTYSDWGKDVIIEAPAPDDIVELPAGAM